ncbi:MAG: universal stress protein [Armatimonadia bacterium]
MYKTIMLTLDRSGLAEQAIPHAVALAKSFGARLEVVSVVPLPGSEATAVTGADVDWELEVATYKEYLAGVMARIADEGVPATEEIRRGNIAEEIIRHVDEAGVDLIVMSTHGRSGVGRWVYGSIADRVLRYAPVPVLLVRAAE